MNETMIKKLAAGEIAVKNDGTLKQLREVLNAAFPTDKSATSGSYNYYLMHSHSTKSWYCADYTSLPSHSISDFYTEDQPEFVRGEVVEVKDDGSWNQRIYLATIEGALYPYICVSQHNETSFKNNKVFNTTPWGEIRKLQPKQIEVTRNEIAAWKGCKPEQIVIV